MQEVESPAAVPTPAPPAEEAIQPPPQPTEKPVGEKLEPEPQAEPGEEPTVAEETPTEPVVWDEWKEQNIASNEELKAAYEQDVQDARKAGYTDYQKRIQPKLDKIAKNGADYRIAAESAVENLQGLLKFAADRENAGTFDKNEFWNEVSRRAPGIVAMTGAVKLRDYQEAGTYISGWLLSMADKIPSDQRQWGMSQDYLNAANAFASATDLSDMQEAVLQIAETVFAEKEKTAEERGYKRGLKEGRTAAVNSAKAGTRQGQGGDTVTGSGGTKPYSQMSAEERAKLTSEERDRLTAQQIGA